MTTTIALRPATPDDALCLSVLAMQVFLDTYATRGISPDLALEALQVYGKAAFDERLASQAAQVTVAACGEHLVGFLDLQAGSACPVPGVNGPEVLRLYVQAPYQRQGLGARLLARAEDQARRRGAAGLWLTTWVGNGRARAFYPAQGYVDVGRTDHVIQGQAFENRVFAKRLQAHDGR